MPQFRIGEQVWWHTFGRYHQGVIKSGVTLLWVTIAQYDRFMSPTKIIEIHRDRLRKYTPAGLNKLNNDIKIIWAGRLQYRQPFFRLGRHKRKEWRKGFERYKKVCKEYGISIR